MKPGEQRESCCGQCPFSRKTKKEYLDTKGQNGQKFAAQAVGPFNLPCHMEEDFDQWETGSPKQCAGAAMYRANTGAVDRLPEQIGTLPSNHVEVFSTPQEMIAHHLGLPKDSFEVQLLASSQAVSMRMQHEMHVAMGKDFSRKMMGIDDGR